MRRLLRILLKMFKWTGLILSTLLLAGTVVFWVRGHRTRDELWIKASDESPLVGLVSNLGSVSLVIHEHHGWKPGVYCMWAREIRGTVQEMMRRAPGEKGWEFIGFGYQHSRVRASWVWTVPCWLVSILVGIWPVSFVTRRVLRKRRYAANQCPGCGYDLRATPDPAGPRLARCPECGRAVVQPASQ